MERSTVSNNKKEKTTKNKARVWYMQKLKESRKKYKLVENLKE